MVARKRRRPPQPAQVSTSIANTRRIRSAHAQARRVRLVVGDRGEVGCAGVGDWTREGSGGLAWAGNDDGSLAATVATGAIGSDGVRAGGGGVEVGIGDAVDHGIGGAIPGGGQDAGGRQRARGARHPWYSTKLMCGRGVRAAKRSRNSCGVKIRWRVPSCHGERSVHTTRPSGSRDNRSCASGGRKGMSESLTAPLK